MSRVLLVGKGPPEAGGIPGFLQLLLDSCLAERHDLRLVNLARAGPPQGGRVTLRNIGRTAADCLRVWRAAAGFDIAHIHSALVPGVTALRAGVLAAMACARGCKVAVHVHGGLLPTWTRRRAGRVLARAALLPAARVAVVSAEAQAALGRVIGSSRVVRVDNSVDTDRFSGPPASHQPPRVLYAGLLSPRKGVLDLLRASAMLHDRGVAHELLVAGGNHEEGAAVEAAVRREAPAHVRFLGTWPHDRMPDLYRSADVFCLPSWWEAMPLSVLEAMACGLPVIATAVGDVPRAVRNGQTGILVPPRAPGALARALEELLTDRQRRRRFGDAGRRHVVQCFGAEVTVQAVARLYATLDEDATRQTARSGRH